MGGTPASDIAVVTRAAVRCPRRDRPRAPRQQPPLAQHRARRPAVEPRRRRERPRVDPGPDQQRRDRGEAPPADPGAGVDREDQQRPDRDAGPDAPGIGVPPPGRLVHAHQAGQRGERIAPRRTRHRPALSPALRSGAPSASPRRARADPGRSGCGWSADGAQPVRNTTSNVARTLPSAVAEVSRRSAPRRGRTAAASAAGAAGRAARWSRPSRAGRASAPARRGS